MGVRSTGTNPTTPQADGHLLEYFRSNFGAGGGASNITADPSGLTASGGIVGAYDVSGTIYAYHVFNNSGTFNVTDVGNLPANVEYLVVGGGGGGGINVGGGGGAGGLVTNLAGHPLSNGSTYAVSATGGPGGDGVYPVTIGSGGSGGNGYADGGNTGANPGGDSVLYGVTAASGGGRGGSRDGSPPHSYTADVGGSGGGGGGIDSTSPGASGDQYSPGSPLNPGAASNQGNSGGIWGSLSIRCRWWWRRWFWW